MSRGLLAPDAFGARTLQQRRPYRFDRTLQFWEWIKYRTLLTSAQLYEDVRSSGALPQHIFG